MGYYCWVSCTLNLKWVSNKLVHYDTHSLYFVNIWYLIKIYSEEITYICNVSIITIQQQLIVSQFIQIFILKHKYRKYRIYIKNIKNIENIRYFPFFGNIVIFSIPVALRQVKSGARLPHVFSVGLDNFTSFSIPVLNHFLLSTVDLRSHWLSPNTKIHPRCRQLPYYSGMVIHAEQNKKVSYRRRPARVDPEP